MNADGHAETGSATPGGSSGAGPQLFDPARVGCSFAGLPPNFPSLQGDKVTNGPAEAHITQILKGKGLMPPFPQLSDEEVAAVATFERTSWGNKGSVIQPSQVAALRK